MYPKNSFNCSNFIISFLCCACFIIMSSFKGCKIDGGVVVLTMSTVVLKLTVSTTVFAMSIVLAMSTFHCWYRVW